MTRLIEMPEMRDRVRVFRDRAHAGEILARLVDGAVGPRAILLAIPAGGVPVACALAQRLPLPLELAVVSKVLLPWDTEAGYGAVAFDGTVQLNEPLVAALELDRRTVEAGVAATRQRVARRMQTLRGGRPFPDLSGTEALLVDDGLASGFTMQVAVQAVLRSGPALVHVAVPTGQADALKRLSADVDTIFCANVRASARFAVADAYQSWRDVDESEVRRMLAAAGAA